MDVGRLLRAGSAGVRLHQRGRLHLRTRTDGTAGARGRTDGISARRILLRDGYLSRVSTSQRGVGNGPCALEGVAVSFWRDRAVLVTGATGLVGSWLARRLADAG